MADPATNDVWKTLSGITDKVLDFKLKSQQIRSTSSPSGNTQNPGVNPFPGTQSAFPQNDTKANFGTGFSMPGWAIALLIGSLVLLVIGLVKR